jgi:hypothetical protein
MIQYPPSGSGSGRNYRIRFRRLGEHGKMKMDRCCISIMMHEESRIMAQSKLKPKLKRRPLSRQVRAKAYRAPMGGAGPHRDRKNGYRRLKKIPDDLRELSGQDGSAAAPQAGRTEPD